MGSGLQGPSHQIRNLRPPEVRPFPKITANSGDSDRATLAPEPSHITPCPTPDTSSKEMGPEFLSLQEATSEAQFYTEDDRLMLNLYDLR